MAFGFRRALCAAALACGGLAGPAQAARVLIVNMEAVGTGSGVDGSRTSSTIRYYNFTNLYLTAIFPLEGIFAPTPNGSGYNIGGVDGPLALSGKIGSGFDFAARYPLQTFVTYAASGSACFSSADPSVIPSGGDQPVDPNCGSLHAEFSDGFAVRGYTFDGAITSLQFFVGEGGNTPSIVFAIPEPSTWALMLAGFGLVGYALRRRRMDVAVA
ncbi:PEPxxWA-CTERM sorting domain-containing protein [Sphingomonas sp. KR1UV-12]|uniref:PEPxxWA-CTERM sorting domain-containing protein n=1 Tax=Sphingomonas aurea TaxID=3063994 RepID=A0ABT9ENB9_9SPHN|nr:PEPxxWA-CTERM sorting domain-containing protein [Sphingomonas sp. KR1UV-12]MDP1028303.1 PEPxxWA-CTERM sorting domain-containing protein [Sphingomonas sp. KR1UV-12]